MKVILQQDVKGQGKKGQLVEVSDGYARNFLLPRKLAVSATADNINTMKQQEKARKAQEAAEKADLVKQGDLVVVTAGVPVGVAGTTNMIRVHLVGGFLLNGVGIGTKNASGPLCVCRSQEDVAAKFHPGDVLVVPYTTNDLLSYIRQAAAVISEESGGNSHAATVGLTLDKAVIVGATGATQRLRDGTMVSVDCVRGVVQTLPQ